MTPTELARLFHERYEALAPLYGYATRPETRVFNENSVQGALMIAVCQDVLAALGCNKELGAR